MERGGGPAAKLRRRAGGGSVISTERGTGLAADVLRGPYSVWELVVPYRAYSVGRGVEGRVPETRW